MFFALLVSFNINAQLDSAYSAVDSCNTQISLLTCTPGTELYSSFGHSAIRVVDSATQTDIIFNYGTFDFDDPDFYSKFVRGKLLYFVSISSLQDFLAEYKYFGRGVTEQVLNLTCPEKKAMVAALYENAKEENKYYHYDFTHDNCTTRLRDMLEKISGTTVQTKNIKDSPGTSFRDMIHSYLDFGKQYWSKFGIDMLLGSRLDRTVSNREAMFLPDYLLKAYDSSTLNNQPLVTAKNPILPWASSPSGKPIFTPLVVFSLLFVLIAAISVYSKTRASTFLKAFDVFFFSVCGLLGFLILFMWFATDHLMCRDNFNLLWALPTHLPMALMLFTKKEWVGNYFRLLFFYSVVLLAAWFLLPQEMNTALLPVLGIIIIRSFFISKRKQREQEL